MPNVQTVLKEEISRVARKEIKLAMGKLKDDNAALKKSVSALKLKVAALERENKKVSKAVSRVKSGSGAPVKEDNRQGRFWVTGKGIRSMRRKLGLTQVELAKLLGVSGQAVYQWETQDGTLKVRSKTKEALLRARLLTGSREARQALDSM
ncbi:MAG: DNA-binding transcriptional regulator YiaG [Kiritimatiellia bacterium]|jgi:DNA-binding transcriptional regulator YiaG